MTGSSPQRLLQQCASTNDERAWEQFLDRYGPCLRAGVRRALQPANGDTASTDRIEEMTQEALCRLLEHGRRLLLACRAASPGELACYLARVGETTTLDRLRRERAEKRGGSRLVALAPEVTQILEERIADAELQPDDRLYLDELRQRFRRLCESFCPRSSRNRRILEAAFLDGLSSREIVHALARDLKVSSVDSLLHRMRHRFLAEGLTLPVRRMA